jgi:beta-lactamase class D
LQATQTKFSLRIKMKKIFIILILGLLLKWSSTIAKEACFIVKENDNFLVCEGDLKKKHSPCSTFKIAISLMGYNEGLLINETDPQWSFEKGYVNYNKNWKQSHNPSLWMKHSCVWYSQKLTQMLGMKKFQEYVRKFSYGNQDTSGDTGKNNGLTQAWLSSSLEISPEEQLQFLQSLIDNKLPVSLKAHEMTRNILFVEELSEGWQLYGKTGNGSQLNRDKTQKLNLQIGWFIGWVQKGDRKIVFVKCIKDIEKQDTYASLRAKDAVKERMLELLKKIN